MKAIVSLLLLITLILWIFTIYFTDKKKFRMVEYNPGEKYLLSRNMYFIILTVCTAPMFLIPYALLKYALWFGVMLFLLFSGKMRIRIDTTMTMYMTFFVWLCFAMTYTTTYWQGTMMLVKYSLPLLFLYLGYSSLTNEKDLIVFLKVVNYAACIYCLIMGGFAQHFIPWLYNFLMDILSVYAAFADFLVAVFIVPIILYWLTKDKKYVYCALWMVLSTVLQSVRTGMGGMVLVFMFAMYLRYKSRSLPGIFFAGAVFISVILFVPSVNEKFFGDDAGTVTGEDIVQGNALSLDNIEMSGREYLWENAKKYCYEGHELIGSGLGTAEYFCKYLMYDDRRESKMHNDYIVLLCDTGNIGVGLLVLFYAVVIVKVIAHVVLRKSNVLVRLTGIMALSSMAGIAFCMYFDNVVSNSMQSMIIPYIYLGFFLKALDIEGKNRRTLAILRFRKERV
ncbi:MAG: O-antigen ligase family protein [Paludibacteraceae bacterium]|nr:O-antigen ligase family protein [Bacteroidaceae bacterium]MBP3575139.1 O-antigen ligase family protein [Paludibacteraceae bacterium]